MNGQANMVVEHNHPHLCGMKCISWSAIFSGVFVGVGLNFLLNLLIAGIGLTAFTATQEGATALAIGGFVGVIIASFISMFFAGWVAAYLGRPYCARRNLGELYGFITWSITLVATIMLASHAGNFISNFNDAVVYHNTSTVNVTTNDAAPLVSQSSRKTASGNTVTNTTVNAEKATNALGVTAFVTFFLFFMGAIASCFGGRLAMRCKKRCGDATGCPACK